MDTPVIISALLQSEKLSNPLILLGTVNMDVSFNGSFKAELTKGKLKITGNAKADIRPSGDDVDASGLAYKLAPYTAANNGYKFANAQASFKYPDGYAIPRQVFSDVLGAWLDKPYANVCNPWRGSSFGMAASSMLFYKGDLSLAEYGGQHHATVADSRAFARIDRLD